MSSYSEDKIVKHIVLIIAILFISLPVNATCQPQAPEQTSHLAPLFAPWRDKADQIWGSFPTNQKNIEGCVFCRQINSKVQEEEQNLILKKREHVIIFLNRYPYNRGHLLIIPRRHTPNFDDFTQDELMQIMQALVQSIAILKKELGCEGINVGINIGKSAGASIPDHIHIHVLPRSHGDTHWLIPLSGTRVISVDPAQVYKKLKPLFEGAME